MQRVWRVRISFLGCDDVVMHNVDFQWSFTCAAHFLVDDDFLRKYGFRICGFMAGGQLFHGMRRMYSLQECDDTHGLPIRHHFSNYHGRVANPLEGGPRLGCPPPSHAEDLRL